MPDQQQAGRGFANAGDGAGGGVEEGGTEMNVGFEVRTLGPFVPGVDGHNRLAKEAVFLGAGNERTEPGGVFCRRAAVHHQPRALPARIVVPAWHQGFDLRKGRDGLGEGCHHDVVIGIDLAAGLGVEIGQRRILQRQPADEFVRGEFDGAVKAEIARVGGVEALRHQQDRVLAVAIVEQAAPAGNRCDRVRDQCWPIDHQQRATSEADVARIAEMAGEAIDQSGLVRFVPILRYQHRLIRTIPAPRPIFIRPHQTERKIEA